MVLLDKENNQSNHSNPKNNRETSDPLGQLNQFHQNINSNSPRANRNGENDQGQQQENGFQKWINQLKSGWSKLLELPIVEKFKENPKWLWISGGAIACFLLLIMVLVAFSGSSDIVEDFETAMLEEDQERLKDLLVSERSELEIDDKFVTKLIEYSKESDRFLSDMVLFLNAQKNIYEENEIEANAFMSEYLLSKNDLFSISKLNLKENSSLFGPDYVISVSPTYIKVSSSVEPTQITLDGEPIEVKKGSKEHLIGPILPGKYTVEASKKYPFSEVIDKDEVDLLKPDIKGKKTATVEFDLVGDEVTFKSEIEGTELFINEKSTGKKVGRRGIDFGPVSTNGSLKAYGQFQFPWGILKSDPVPVEKGLGGVDITPNPLSDSKTKDEVIKVINKYSQEVVEAQEKRDGTLFTTLDEKQKNDWINEMQHKKEYQSKRYYRGKAIKTVIAVKRATITQGEDADTYKIKVPVQYHRHEREYNQFDKGDEPLKEKISDQYTWLTYNHKEKKWEISGLAPIFFAQDLFKDSSVVTIDFEK